jgi:outer membrane receptor protein involved in Fe transport
MINNSKYKIPVLSANQQNLYTVHRTAIRNSLKIMSILSCLSFASPTIAEVEIARTDRVIESLLKMDLEELMNVQVTIASKKAQKTAEAPSSITVFTQRELRAMGITSVEELMNFVPGFQATREVVFNQGYVVSGRGQGTPQASYNILFMLDGERLNDELGGGALTNNHFMTLANVKQVEIIRGPGSALYGTSAFTGVVNIITKTDSNEVAVNTGNSNYREVYTNLSQQGESWQASLFARHFKDNGQDYEYPGMKSMLSDSKKGNDVYVQFRWKDQLRLNGRYMQREMENFLDRGLGVPDLANFDSQQNFVNFDYRLLNTEQAELTLKGSYLTNTYQETEGTTVREKIAIQHRLNKENRWRFSLEQHYSWNDRHELYGGLVWRKNKLDQIEIVDRDLTTGQVVNVINNEGVEGISREVVSAYLEDHYRFSDNIELTLGVRHDRYSDFGGTTNPRAALTYAATSNTKFKWMYGEAFRAPSFRQTTGPNGLGNPNLDPEIIKTAEFAWIQTYPYAQTTLTYFQSQSQDKIDTVVIPTGFGRTFKNLAGIDTAGVELELSAEIGDLTLRTAYTHLTKTEENPRTVAQRTFSMIANYQYGSWNFNLNGYYHDEMEQSARLPKIGLTTLTLSDYWVWNSAIRYAWSENIDLVAQVHNLLDEEYFSSTKLINYTVGLPNRERTYSLGIEMRF